MNNKKNKRHGLRNTRIYRVWRGIKTRIFNKNCLAYKDYGGRGIKMNKEWADNPLRFNEWAIKAGYQEGLTIERKNVDGDYEPDNCIFIPQSQQMKNRRINVKYNGICMAEKEREMGFSVGTIHNRIKSGWTLDKAFTTPLLKNRKDTLVEISKKSGVKLNTLKWRLYNGWSLEDATKLVGNIEDKLGIK